MFDFKIDSIEEIEKATSLSTTEYTPQELNIIAMITSNLRNTTRERIIEILQVCKVHLKVYD